MNVTRLKRPGARWPDANCRWNASPNHTVSQGKLVLERREAPVMASAAESLPRRYGTKVTVHVALDERQKPFVTLRRR